MPQHIYITSVETTKAWDKYFWLFFTWPKIDNKIYKTGCIPPMHLSLLHLTVIATSWFVCLNNENKQHFVCTTLELKHLESPDYPNVTPLEYPSALGDLAFLAAGQVDICSQHCIIRRCRCWAGHTVGLPKLTKKPLATMSRSSIL